MQRVAKNYDFDDWLTINFFLLYKNIKIDIKVVNVIKK
jgi:hypothetical protein